MRGTTRRALAIGVATAAISLAVPANSMATVAALPTWPANPNWQALNNTGELMARFGSDDTANALNLMRRLWGLQVGPNSGFYTGTFWEFVGSNGLPTRGFDSLAQAWGAGPTQVPTARGSLAVRWAQDTAGQFHLQVVAPAGTGGEVWVPLASATATSSPLTAGATFLRRSGTYHVYRVGAGIFEFSSTP